MKRPFENFYDARTKFDVIITNDLPGLDKIIKEAFPNAVHQKCRTHKNLVLYYKMVETGEDLSLYKKIINFTRKGVSADFVFFIKKLNLKSKKFIRYILKTWFDDQLLEVNDHNLSFDFDVYTTYGWGF